MGKLERKSFNNSEKSISSTSREKQIIDRKEKAKLTVDNPLLTSVPVSMQNTMKFIDAHNEKAKLSPNYGQKTNNPLNLENLADNDIFNNFFRR